MGLVLCPGLACYAFTTDDEVGRRRAAAQLVTTEIASLLAIAAGCGIGQATLVALDDGHFRPTG